MKKSLLKKKLLSLLLCSVVAVSSFTNGVTAFAKEQQPSPKAVIVSAYYVTDNGLVRLTDSEIADYENQVKNQDVSKPNIAELMKSNSISEVSPKLDGTYAPAGYDLSQRYVESGRINEYYKSSATQLACNPLQNTTADPATKTLTWAASQSAIYTSSVTLTMNEKSIIDTTLTASFGGTWETTLSTSSSDQISIPSKEYGWFEFTPIMRNSWGYSQLYDRTTGVVHDSKFVDTYAPKHLSNGTLYGVVIGKTGAYGTWVKPN